jgi:8-oxo-dGTP diphosphatase
MPDYFRPSVTVDIAVFATDAGTLKLLLIRRGHEPFAGFWALPGGFIEPDETLEASARRELLEETGLQVGALTPVATFGDPGRDPRGRTLTVLFRALLPSLPVVSGQDDASEAAWFALDALPPLAFDHDRVIAAAIADLRAQAAHHHPHGPLSEAEQALLG